MDAERQAALAVYLPVELEEEPSPLPRLGEPLGIPLDGSLFLDEVVRRRPSLDEPTRQRAGNLGCAVVLAEGVSHAEAVDAVRATVSLGLEHHSRGILERAEERLERHGPEPFFSIGISLAVELRLFADELTETGTASLPGTRGTLFDSSQGALFCALRRMPPLYPLMLDDRALPSGETRRFREVGDLLRCRDALQGAVKMAELMAELGFDAGLAAQHLERTRSLDELEAVRFSHLYLTACAGESIGGGFQFLPLPRHRHADVLARVYGPAGEVRGDFAQRLGERIREAAAGSSDPAGYGWAADYFLKSCFERLAEGPTAVPFLFDTPPA